MHIAKLMLCLGCMGLSSAALAGTGFCTPDPITIADAAIAAPYPSAVAVTGSFGSITGVTVTLNGFSHDFPDDVGMVLVGPTGQALLLQSGAGDATPIANVTYSFADTGATVLPDLTAWSGGTYRPTNYYPPDVYPAPGPLAVYSDPGPAGGGTATFATTFGGTTSNGTWNLFIADFVGGDSGSISGGWCIDFTGTPVLLQHFSVD